MKLIISLLQIKVNDCKVNDGIYVVVVVLFIVYLGPCIFTIVNIKQRPTTLTLSHATMAHALHVSGCYSLE